MDKLTPEQRAALDKAAAIEMDRRDAWEERATHRLYHMHPWLRIRWIILLLAMAATPVIAVTLVGVE